MSRPPRAATADEVPVLDLAPLNTGGDLGLLAGMLRHACVTTGFFYVKNHGIPAPIFDGVFDATRRYFDLPEAQRLAHRMDERFRRGFMPQGINQHPRFRARSQGKLRDRHRPVARPPRRGGGPAAARPEPLARGVSLAARRRGELLQRNHGAGQAAAARVRRQPGHADGLLPAMVPHADGADAVVPLPAAAADDRRPDVRRRPTYRLRHDHPAVAGPHRRAGTAQARRRVDRRAVHSRHAGRQLGRSVPALDQRHLPLEPAPRGQPQRQGALLDPDLLQPGLQRRGILPADLPVGRQPGEIRADPRGGSTWSAGSATCRNTAASLPDATRSS